MRLFVNALHTQTGGGKAYLAHLLAALAAHAPGWKVRVLLANGVSVAVPPGVEVVQVRVPGPTVVKLLAEQALVPLLAWVWRADVTLCNANYVPFLAPRPVPILHSTTQAGQWARGAWMRVYWPVLRAVTRLSVRRAAAVATVSPALAAEFGAKNAVWAPPGAAPAPAAEVRQPGLVLAVGDVYPHKNYPALVAAFARVVATHPAAELCLVGRNVDPVATAALDAAVQNAGLGARVRRTGVLPHEAVQSLMAHCGVYVSVSRAESFSMTTLEALAAGAPCVLPDVPFQREVAGTAAHVVANPEAPGFEQRLAAALTHLMDTPDDAAALTAAGRVRAAPFTWARTAAAVADAVMRAARESRPA